jgi:zinc transport system substrate-binding protein
MKLVILLMGIMLLAGCTREQAERPHGKLQVVTTLFPLYDMARAIGGEYADVSLLLPPGVEAHSFEPRPGDILRLHKADLFISTGPFMEPWAESLLKGVDGKRLIAISAGSGIPLMKQGEEQHHDNGHGHQGGGDPHIWLDFHNAQTMVTTILAGFTATDPTHAPTFRLNAARYQARLEDLDRAYRTGLATCQSRTIIHAGHFAFGYLAKRYGLRYLSAYPASGDSEPNARQMATMVELIRSSGNGAIYYEELVSPRLADTLAKETGARLLLLSAAHNVSRDDLAHGVTFPELMEHNLENLRQGLRCR